MTDNELFQFSDAFKGLERIFPKRLEEHERVRMTGDYFRILRKFTLQQIQAGAEAWIQRGKYFPKPAEWIDAIPKRRVDTADDVPLMGEQEAHEYHRAESLRYDDAPCKCRLCVAAGMTEKALRFVPDVNPDGSDRKLKDGERIVTAGHWAHGTELARWYEARADFYNQYLTVFGKLPEVA